MSTVFYILQMCIGLFGIYVLYKFRVKSRGRARKLITWGGVAGILLPMVLGIMQSRDAMYAYGIAILTTLGFLCILLGLLQFLKDVDLPEVE